jgi:hypothetical protein
MLKAEGLGRFQVDDQLDLGGLLNWKTGRLLPLENTAGVYSNRIRTPLCVLLPFWSLARLAPHLRSPLDAPA